MGPPSHRRSIIDRNVVMRCIPVVQVEYFNLSPGSYPRGATGCNTPGTNNLNAPSSKLQNVKDILTNLRRPTASTCCLC